MKKKSALYFLFFLGLMSCRNECERTQIEIQSLMKDLYKNKITFPAEMEILNSQAVTNDSIVKKQPPKKFTVVHFFTADCDKCVNELLMMQSFLKRIDHVANLDVMFIASAPTKVYVLDAIKETQFPYPVHYEKKYYSFKSMNKLPLEDDLFDTFLMNSKNEVIIFGAFYNNDKAENLFLKSIECGL